MMKWLRNIVIKYLTRNLLKAVTRDDVIQMTATEWMVGKRKLTQEEVKLLRDEARSLRESMLLKYLIRELKYGVTLQRYDEATTADDMIFGKAMAYSISEIEVFIKRLSEVK
jgi:hypothetical protein